MSKYALPTRTKVCNNSCFSDSKKHPLVSFIDRDVFHDMLDELSGELVRVTMELEEMQEQASRVSGMEQELSLLQQRHKAALEMLGEKTEEVQELRADLLDVKEAYRDQIGDLLGQLESLRRANAH